MSSVDKIRVIAATLPTRDALLQATIELQRKIEEQQKELDKQTSLIEKKVEIIDKKSMVIEQQQSRIITLEEYLRLSRANRFGRSSEKNDRQGELFNEAELLSDSGDQIDALEQASEPEQQKKKRKTGNKGLSPSLPRVQVHLELTEEEKQGAINTFYVLVKEELDITPAKVQVIEYLQQRAVFADEQGKRNIVSAKRETRVLGKAVASVSLLAWLIVSKYADGLPLYRLEGILKRYGGEITRTTLANWLIRLAPRLTPLLERLRHHQLQADYLQGDETRMQVLKEPGYSATGDKWMWVIRGGPPGQPVVLFEYDKSRGGKVATRLLESFQGRYFQSDGYSGYNPVCVAKNIIRLGCWDHARRKFKEAIKAQPSGKNKSVSKATMGLSLINALYRIEREIKLLTEDEKLEQRQKRSLPALAKLKAWLETNAPKTASDSLTRTAMNYSLNQWPHLIRYCDAGHLHISNVLAENAIRPFVVGRKAWMFADTPAGANASALYFSLIETAKANDVEPYQYLLHVLKNISAADTDEALDALLPWNMK